MSLTTNIENIFKKGVIGNVRKAQEDSHDIFLKTPNGDVFVVCDGMGGHVGGAVASSMAVKSIKEYMEMEVYPDPIQALNGALQFANQQILGYSQEHPELKGMGTTACIVLFKGDEAWIAHVGDSRIYLFLGKEKKLHRITKDHSFVQSLVDAGQITDEEAEHHPNKNRILKALGILPEVVPTFNYENKPILPKNGDIFLICSDGLCGMISDATIERVLSEETGLEQKGDQLIGLAMEGETVQPGGQDNCTLELIQVDNSPWKTSEFKSYNPASREQKQEAMEPSRRSPMSAKAIAAIVVGALLLLAGGWYVIHYLKSHDVGPANSVEQQIQERISVLDSLIHEEEEDLNRAESDLAEWQERLDRATESAREGASRQVDHFSRKKTECEERIGLLQQERDSLERLLNRPVQEETPEEETLEEETPREESPVVENPREESPVVENPREENPVVAPPEEETQETPRETPDTTEPENENNVTI